MEIYIIAILIWIAFSMILILHFKNKILNHLIFFGVIIIIKRKNIASITIDDIIKYYELFIIFKYLLCWA